MLMERIVDSEDGTIARSDNRRRHRRRWVLRSATLWPVREEAAFAIANISHLGVMGRCATTLSLRQRVFLTLNGHRYMSAEVRWADGERYGLQLEDPFFCPSGAEPEPSAPRLDLAPRSLRIPVEMAATLVTTAPVLGGRIRNVSDGGMMIETGIAIPEAERLLIKMKDQPAMVGRVQWSREGRIGVRLEREIAENPEI